MPTSHSTTTQWSPDDASRLISELAEIIASTPEWELVKEAMVAAWNAFGTESAVVEAGRQKLQEVGLSGEHILVEVPEPYRELMTPEVEKQVIEALDLYLVASCANDIVTGRPLPFFAFAGGSVSIETAERDGLAFSVVHAYATPLGDPEDIAARFLLACYQTFDTETFSKREEGIRDAEWWRRRRSGESYREIALSDGRSGLAPEAKVSPHEYPDEVRRATDKVRRADRRFKARWTQKVESLSKETGSAG